MACFIERKKVLQLLMVFEKSWLSLYANQEQYGYTKLVNLVNLQVVKDSRAIKSWLKDDIEKYSAYNEWKSDLLLLKDLLEQ